MKGFRSIPKAKCIPISGDIDIVRCVHFIYCKISEEQKNFLVYSNDSGKTVGFRTVDLFLETLCNLIKIIIILFIPHFTRLVPFVFIITHRR